MNLAYQFSSHSKIFVIGVSVVLVIITSFYLTTAIPQNLEVTEPISKPTESASPITPDITQKQSNDETSLQASEILDECGTNPECVVEYLITLSKLDSQEALLSTTLDIVSAWEDDDFYCHDMAHPIGAFLFSYFEGDLVKAISHVNNNCGNALYHGVVENYLPRKVSLESINVEDFDITTPCMELGSTNNSYVGLQCVHGMGHSLTKVYNYDVLKAVKRCDEFQILTLQEMCQDGLFMENAVAYYKGKGGDFDENDIFYPCNKLDEKHQKICFIFQGSYILSQNNFNPSKTFEQCDKLSLEVSIRSCYYGVANHMVLIYFDSIEETAAMCKELNPNYQMDCISVAVGDITLYVDPELSDDFCKLFSEDQLEYCIKEWTRIQERHDSTEII